MYDWDMHDELQKEFEKYNANWYAGYAAWLLSSHHSVPSFIPFLYFCQTGRNRSGRDPLDSTSISNYSSSPKSGEKEDCLFLLELGDSESRPDRFWWWLKVCMCCRGRLDMKLNGRSNSW